MPIKKAIVFTGNTGSGKSFVCNKIFQMCGSPTRFASTGSTYSVTQALQQGSVKYRGNTYTLVDTPGFFDTSRDGSSNDGPNLCKLVKALESCEEIMCLVFVFTDRFSAPHKIWFERMRQLVSEAHRGNIVLLHNKLGEMNSDVQAENKVEIKQMLGSQQTYIWYSYKQEGSGTETETKTLLDTAVNFTPFQLRDLVIPEICYERTEEGKPYEKELVNNRTDDGHSVTETKDTSHYEEELVPDHTGNDPFTVLMKVATGAKQIKKTWVDGTKEEKKWVPNEVTKRIIGTYVDVYKVRFDNTRDKVKEREVSRREEIY